MIETWRSIPGLEGLYEVSDQGSVRRVHGPMMVGGIGVRGYRLVTLCLNGKGTTYNVHRLVTVAFLGPRPQGKQVNHIDGNRTNNALINLEYVTAKENTQHAIRLGLREATMTWTKRKPELLARGSRHGNAKLTEALVRTIRAMRATGASARIIGMSLGVNKQTVENIVYGSAWKHVAGAP